LERRVAGRHRAGEIGPISGVFQARVLTEQLDKIEELAREQRDPGSLVPIMLNLLRKLDRDLRRRDCQTFI